MKKVWKWIIGIVVVLVIVAVLVGGALMLRSHFANVVYNTRVSRPGVQVPGNGKFPNGQRGWPGGMMPYGYGGRGHMGGFGMMNPLGGIFGGLISLGFLALIVLGIIWVVRSLRKPTVASAPVAATTPSAPLIAAAVTHPCKKCGEPVQEDWKFCPNCGKKV